MGAGGGEQGLTNRNAVIYGNAGIKKIGRTIIRSAGGRCTGYARGEGSIHIL